MREERKVVSALFADVVGSTQLGERLDPEDVRDIMGGAIARIIHAVEGFGGTVKDLAGDGVLALFGAPISHEDDAERAVRAGLEIVKEIGDYGVHIARDWEVEGFAVRVGIETGLVVLGPVGAGARIEYGATGDAINTAARLQSHARPGSVLVSGSTQRAVEPLFEWGEPQHYALKGKTDPVLALEARGVRPVPGSVRGLEGAATPFVGRQDELTSAAAVLRTLLAGSGGMLFVSGEPGIGKSRLLAELRHIFERSPAGHGRPLWLEGRCVSFGQSLPYLPIRDLLREWLGASADHPEEEARSALRHVMEALFGKAADEVSPYLGAVLGLTPRDQEASVLSGLSPEALLHRTVEAFRRLLAGLSGRGPLIVAVEDLHWADSSSVQMIERLLPLALVEPVLFLMAQRPEEDHPASRLIEEAQRRFPGRTTVISLQALPDEADLELLDSLIGTGTLPAEVEDRILETAEGNPFYLEELVRSLMDAGALSQANGGWRFDPGAHVEIPSTVEKVILARVDRLDADCHSVLTAASVLGRRFTLPLLQEVSGGNGTLAGALAQLRRLDLIRERGQASQPEYFFKHALIQETVYNTLLKRRRRELHRRAAEAIESMFTDQLETHYGLLAHHYRRANDLGAALTYHRKAADAARRVYAVEEALKHLAGALEVAAALGMGTGDPVVSKLLLDRGRVLAQTGDSPGARRDFETALEGARAGHDRATEMHALDELGFALAGAADYGDALGYLDPALGIAEALDDTASRVRILSRLSLVHSNQLRFDRGLEYGQQAMELARRVGDDRILAVAMDSLKQVAMEIGDFSTLEDIGSQLAEIHRRHGDLWYLQFVVFELAFMSIATASWEEAFARLDESLAIGRTIGDRGNEPLHLGAFAWAHRSRGDYGRALAAGREAVALAHQLGHAEWTSWSEGQLGITMVELHALEEAASHLRRGKEAAERAGARMHVLRCVGHLAWVHWLQGDGERALALADRAEDVVAQIALPPGRAYVPGRDAYVSVARVRLAGGEPERAESLLRPIVRACEACDWQEGVALGSLVIGLCRDALGDRSGAARCLGRALKVAEGAGLPGAEREAHTALAGLRRAEGRIAEAERHAARAADLIERLSATIDDETIRSEFVAAAAAQLRAEGRTPT